MAKSRQTQRGEEIERLRCLKSIPQKPATKTHASVYLEIGEYSGILHEWSDRKKDKNSTYQYNYSFF